MKVAMDGSVPTDNSRGLELAFLLISLRTL